MNNRSIGKSLKNRRLELDLSLEEVAFQTRIRKEYVEAIEKDNFSKFDSHVYAKGFIKNYAKFLKLDEEALLSVYRRDFENMEIKRKIQKVSDEDVKEEKSKKLKLKNIKFTNRQIGLSIFSLFIVALLILVLNLVNQAFSPPYLKITAPSEILSGNTFALDYFESNLVIKGETTPYTLIKINEAPIALSNTNQFESSPLSITSDKNIFVITATNQLGITSKITLEVNKKDESLLPKDNISGTVTITGDRAVLKILGDDEVIFEGSAFINDAFPVLARTRLQIETRTPENVIVYVNNKEFRLAKRIEVFVLEGGELVNK